MPTTRTRKLEGNPADRRIDGPDAVIPKRREENPDAASRLSIEKARVGNELSPIRCPTTRARAPRRCSAPPRTKAGRSAKGRARK